MECSQANKIQVRFHLLQLVNLSAPEEMQAVKNSRDEDAKWSLKLGGEKENHSSTKPHADIESEQNSDGGNSFCSIHHYLAIRVKPTILGSQTLWRKPGTWWGWWAPDLKEEKNCQIKYPNSTEKQTTKKQTQQNTTQGRQERRKIKRHVQNYLWNERKLADSLGNETR